MLPGRFASSRRLRRGARLSKSTATPVRPPQHISVNLDDPSTYQVDTALVQRAATTSIRPPLTGDLQSIPMNEILRRGFPPRPDVTRDPARYQQWVDLVSKPHAARDVTFVVAPGRQAGPYAGSFNDIEDPGSGGPAWGGRAYDSAGWHALSGDPDISIAPNENLNWYLEYDTQMYLPSTSCSPGGCQAFQWAGMGGMEALDGKTNGTLIQSGVHLQNTSAPVPFVEYYPSPPSYPAGYTLNAGDAIEFWGWLATSTACAANDTGRTAMVACFGFYDWSTSEFIPASGSIAITIPSGKTYYGYTFESIMEKIPNVNFINFSSVQFSDTADDNTGAYHNAASDAWVFLNAVSESRHPLTTSHNPDGTTNDEQWYQTDWDGNYF